MRVSGLLCDGLERQTDKELKGPGDDQERRAAAAQGGRERPAPLARRGGSLVRGRALRTSGDGSAPEIPLDAAHILLQAAQLLLARGSVDLHAGTSGCGRLRAAAHGQGLSWTRTFAKWFRV
jgi:hypothetical protein